MENIGDLENKVLELETRKHEMEREIGLKFEQQKNLNKVINMQARMLNDMEK